MKNILLTLVLVLTVSFAFAGNEIEKTSIVEVGENLVVELTMEIDLTEFLMDISIDNKIETTFDTCERRSCFYGAYWSFCTEWEEYDCAESEL